MSFQFCHFDVTDVIVDVTDVIVDVTDVILDVTDAILNVGDVAMSLEFRSQHDLINAGFSLRKYLSSS